MHHRLPRGLGGTTDPVAAFGMANLISLHRACHERIESRRGEAYDAGWLLRHNGIEAGDPEETSLLYQARGWAWLTHNGRIIRAREDSQ